MKIKGNTVGTTMPRSDWAETNEKKASFIKNKPEVLNGVSCTHRWEGTTLIVTSASGTSSADLKGEKGDSAFSNLPIALGETDTSLVGNDLDGNKAIGDNSTVFGKGNVVGGLGFKIINLDPATNKIVLDSVEGLAEGDIYSMTTNPTTEDCGKILSVSPALDVLSQNIVYVDKIPTEHYDGFINAEASRRVFWINAKPEVGTMQLRTEAFSSGSGNAATGMYSASFGSGNKSYGKYSSTEGKNNTAYYCGHGEGCDNTVRGFYGHGEGRGNTINGEYGHGEGIGNLVDGIAAHSEGQANQSMAACTHTEGYNNKALAPCAHAEGSTNIAKLDNTHVEGYKNIASSWGQHVQGMHNIEDPNGRYCHIVGNGADEDHRSNAHTLDWNGNAWFAGSVEGTKLILKSSGGSRYEITISETGQLVLRKI